MHRDHGATCKACASMQLHPLPLPNSTQSVLSDGRIWPKPVQKVFCLSCGLISHTNRLTQVNIRQFYDQSYELGVSTSSSDNQRGCVYARQIASLIDGPTPARVLEVGCGPGKTLAAMAEFWPQARLTGLEAAPSLAPKNNPDATRFDFQIGFAEDLPAPREPFDLVCSVNVVEHAVDPRTFLKALARQTAPDGMIILICPRQDPPNLELVFQDHIHSFSTGAMGKFAADVGLSLVKHIARPEGIGDFQVFVLKHNHEQSNSAFSSAAKDALRWRKLANACEQYLGAWQGLDGDLETRVGNSDTIKVFGAGEMTALIRCYAPRVWQRASMLLVDELAGARNLDRPVRRLAETPVNEGVAILIATHPRSQSQIAKRLSDLGHRTVVFNDLIAC